MNVAKALVVFLLTAILGGCSTFQEVGQGAKDVGSTVKEDFRTIGPTMKKGFSDMKEGFSDLGRGASGDAKESVEEIKH